MSLFVCLTVLLRWVIASQLPFDKYVLGNKVSKVSFPYKTNPSFLGQAEGIYYEQARRWVINDRSLTFPKSLSSLQISNDLRKQSPFWPIRIMIPIFFLPSTRTHYLGPLYQGHALSQGFLFLFGFKVSNSKSIWCPKQTLRLLV